MRSSRSNEALEALARIDCFELNYAVRAPANCVDGVSAEPVIEINRDTIN